MTPPLPCDGCSNCTLWFQYLQKGIAVVVNNFQTEITAYIHETYTRLSLRLRASAARERHVCRNALVTADRDVPTMSAHSRPATSNGAPLFGCVPEAQEAAPS